MEHLGAFFLGTLLALATWSFLRVLAMYLAIRWTGWRPLIFHEHTAWGVSKKAVDALFTDYRTKEIMTEEYRWPFEHFAYDVIINYTLQFSIKHERGQPIPSFQRRSDAGIAN